MPEQRPADDSLLVDDLYWLRRAGDLVTAGANLRVDAARQLMSALAWLWTVYTGATIVGAISAEDSLPTLAGVALAMPSFFIVFAYASAVIAYMPLTMSFNPIDPEEIRVAYTRAVQRGWRRLRIALAMSCLAAASLALAIGVLATST